MSDKTLDERIMESINRARRLKVYDLALQVFPHDKFPRAWRYSSNGGPPGWVMPLGKAIKRLGLKTGIDGDGKRWVSK